MQNNPFGKLELRVGKVIKAEYFEGARKPAIKLWIDFGELGIKKSSAQITKLYTPENLIGMEVVAITNLKPKQIGHFISEVLVLGVNDSEGNVVLLVPQKAVPPGHKIY
jgi:tRNA-binding protein